MGYRRTLAATALMVTVVSLPGLAFGERIADIARTKHNFSAAPEFAGNLQGNRTRTVRAVSEQQICVFCHTPHAANATQGPLWNREIPDPGSYTTYSSSSIDATNVQTNPDGSVSLEAPNGVSKLCLSCHDGSMAIGAVNVLNGTFTDRSGLTAEIAMTGTSPGGVMAPGEGPTTGFTRFLGKDLTNDHPISVRFDQELANRDGEMRFPNAESHIVVRGVDPVRPQVNDIHLEPDPTTTTGGLVQCNSCHDPHIRDTTEENIKFLRLNRLQKVDPVDGPFSKTNDIICLACHNKAGWAGSAHANSQVANEQYTNAAADVREFPRGTQVWQTACLACHDTHTVEGSRRLLREGVDGSTTPSSSGYNIKTGFGQSAIEETCYTCHDARSNVPASVRTLVNQGTPGFEVPDTGTDFTTMATHMPITTADQNAGFEAHDIGSPDYLGREPLNRGKDLLENVELMGANGNLNNRHAECPDCHNMHRVIKNRVFNANPFNPDLGGTHDHSPVHTNFASGVLKGVWGVEPDYSGQTPFGTLPTSFNIKRGNPAVGASTAVTQPYLTREYQLCFKCHSNFAFGTNPPALGSSGGGTPPGTNGMFTYTNIAMEYNSPNSHQGEGTAAGSGAGFTVNNHRSWHPVVNTTGRTAMIRGGTPASANLWLPPFAGPNGSAVGNQNMYCTDCHGSNTPAGSPVPNGGENGSPWGPHGSDNNFILKGPWSGDVNTGTGADTGANQRSHLCFKCHRFEQYAQANTPAANVLNSGFRLAGMCMGMCMGGGMMGGVFNNLHVFHNQAVTNFRCNLCHIAVPHGWKNKVFLANLNDVKPDESVAGGVGIERRYAGDPATPVVNGFVSGLVAGPYYNRAALKVASFATSGTWVPTNCGSIGQNGNGLTGVPWMAGNGGMGPGGMMGGGGGGGGGGAGGGNEACINLP